jgi:heptaprenyl diphosphate synthase
MVEPSVPRLIRSDASDHRVARYAAAAIVLSVAEAAIPTPLPGVKPGLANIVVLLVLLRHGWSEAAWVALLRVFATSLLLGQLFAPGFFLTLALLAAIVHLPRRWFGPVSLSVLAAFAHIGGQMLLARVWLVPHAGLWALWPVFSATATFFGIVNGLITARLQSAQANPSTSAPAN